jgi:branched-chain amino acid transport system ATP-binding protein
MSELMLSARGLTLSFGGVRAVRDVSFDVRVGEILALIGPNGAGKTSVFNLLSRVFNPSAGEVDLQGTALLQVPRHDVIRHGVARTFQNIELFEGATVLDNLLLGCHSMSKAGLLAQLFQTASLRANELANRQRVEDVIDFLGLAKWRRSQVSGLPYGVRKNIELGRALVTKPKLLLLDEPASGLNVDETERLGTWIREVRDRFDVTVVMVEHDMSLVSRIADSVIAMDQGSVLVRGTALEVQTNPEVVASYLGAPQ